jgi:hypothetical protein
MTGDAATPAQPTQPTKPPRQPVAWRRPAIIGFVVGFVAAFLITMLALISVAFEVVHPYLVPAAPLLRPVADGMADWPGLVIMVVAGVVNGLIYAAVFVLGALVLHRGRSND